MIGRRRSRRDSRNHGRLGMSGSKTILENKSELAATIRNMLWWLVLLLFVAALLSLLSQGTDAFFKTQQRSIDFGGFRPTLRIVGFGIGTTFASGQIDQG
jgi:hypothetical protein